MEQRWNKRGALFPNTSWAKNQHLITEEGGVRAAVDDAYAQAYALDQETIAASHEWLTPPEVEKRQQAKEAVDAASQLITRLHDQIKL